MKILIYLNTVAIILLLLARFDDRAPFRFELKFDRTFWKKRILGINLMLWRGNFGTGIFYLPLWKESWVNDKPRQNKKDRGGAP